MGWNDAAETIVAGGGQVYTAPVGTALPASADAELAPANYTGLGYHSEDGVSVNKALEIVEFRAWQSKHPIRRERETEDFLITFALQQWNENTTPLAFGGGAIESVGAGQYKYTPPADTEQLDERTLICDVDDGDRRIRFVIPRGTITEGVESAFSRSQMAQLPVSFKSLEPEDGGEAWYFLTNDDVAFTAGS